MNPHGITHEPIPYAILRDALKFKLRCQMSSAGNVVSPLDTRNLVKGCICLGSKRNGCLARLPVAGRKNSATHERIVFHQVCNLCLLVFVRVSHHTQLMRPRELQAPEQPGARLATGGKRVGLAVRQ
jgi:hypothetical protein